MDFVVSRLSGSTKAQAVPDIIELYLSYMIPTSESIMPLKQPKVRIYVLVNGKERLYGETEAIQQTSQVKFKTTFVVHYHFEANQKIRFEVLAKEGDKWESVSNINTSLGEILGSQNQTAVYRIIGKNGKCGKLLVRFEKIKEDNSTAFFEISARKLSSRNNFFRSKVYYLDVAKLENSEEIELYRTEPIKKETNAEWKKFGIPTRLLSDNDSSGGLRFNVYSKKIFGEKLSGQCDFTLDQLVNEKKREFVLSKPGQKKKYGILEITNFYLGKDVTFVDYLTDGLKLNSIFAVDLTSPKAAKAPASKTETEPGSFHSPVKSKPNVTERKTLLTELCQALLHYSENHKAAFYGIGGKPSNKPQSKDFAISGNEKESYIAGTEAILEAYNQALGNVSAFDIAYLQPTLSRAIETAKHTKRHGSKEYNILVVMLQNTMVDIEATFQAISECASLPLSIIILGLGENSFESMKRFYKQGFFQSKEAQSERNFVQFVTLSDFSGDIQAMTQEVLKDIPNQVLQYMKINKVAVGPQKEIDLQKVLDTQKSVNVNDIGEEMPALSLPSLGKTQSKAKSFTHLDDQDLDGDVYLNTQR